MTEDLTETIRTLEARADTLIKDAQRKLKSPEAARALLQEAEVVQLRAVRMQMAISFPAIVSETS